MISQKQLENLKNFIGYGNLNAPLWFIGIEDGLGNRPNVPGWSLEWELSIRSTWLPVMDMHDAHVMLQDMYWENENYSSVWVVMR